jgi:hypothetical protein
MNWLDETTHARHATTRSRHIGTHARTHARTHAGCAVDRDPLGPFLFSSRPSRRQHSTAQRSTTLHCTAPRERMGCFSGGVLLRPVSYLHCYDDDRLELFTFGAFWSHLDPCRLNCSLFVLGGPIKYCTRNYKTSRQIEATLECKQGACQQAKPAHGSWSARWTDGLLPCVDSTVSACFVWAGVLLCTVFERFGSIQCPLLLRLTLLHTVALRCAA